MRTKHYYNTTQTSAIILPNHHNNNYGDAAAAWRAFANIYCFESGKKMFVSGQHQTELARLSVYIYISVNTCTHFVVYNFFFIFFFRNYTIISCI